MNNKSAMNRLHALIRETLNKSRRRWHLRILAVCCVANARRATSPAALCALHPIQNRSASFPPGLVQSFLIFIALLLHAPVNMAAPGAHGPNGEHLDMPAGAAASADAAPQFETMSEFLEITGHLHADSQQLRLYVNHFDTSEPVLDAATDVEVQVVLPGGDITADAMLDAGEGAYIVTDAALLDALRPAGEYPLMLTVMGPEGSRWGSDLLEAKLHVPETGAEAADAGPPAHWLTRVPLHFWLTLTLLFALRLFIDIWRWSRCQFAGAQP